MARFKSWTREREQMNSERWNAIALGRNCWRLLQQLQVRDLGYVLDQQRMQQVCYCLDDSVVRFISPSDEIPWNVLFFFSRYSKKLFFLLLPVLISHTYTGTWTVSLISSSGDGSTRIMGSLCTPSLQNCQGLLSVCLAMRRETAEVPPCLQNFRLSLQSFGVASWNQPSTPQWYHFGFTVSGGLFSCSKPVA